MGVKSYVYRCEHKLTGKFYIGYRYANTVPAKEDLGKFYFTSCREIKSNFQEYNFEVLSEYDSASMAYEVEQVLLYNLRNNPLIINGDNFRKKHHISLDPKPAEIEPSDKEKWKNRRALLRSYSKTNKRKRSGRQDQDMRPRNLRKEKKRKIV